METWSSKVKAIHKVTDTHIYGFFDKHRYLSNFHLHSIEYEGILYPSNENAYQAAKITDYWGHILQKEARMEFAEYTPSKAKSKGRELSLRADWHNELPIQTIHELRHGEFEIITQVRDKVMYDINVIKFSNPHLKNLLLSTGDKYLEETNWWKDDYWGVIHEKGGLNKLGRILMKIREELKKN